MDREFVIIEILVFAIIALYLVLRLRSVLGRRTKEEQHQPNPLVVPSREEGGPAQSEQIRSLPHHMHPANNIETIYNNVKESLVPAIAQIKAADSKFSQSRFLQGAEAAFNVIVNAYAKGDIASLQSLLSDELYNDFNNSIQDQIARGEIREIKIVQIKQIDLLEASMKSYTAFIVVKFTSDQINITRNQDGVVIEGNPSIPIEIADIWTFSRDTRSTNPNWVLVESKPQN